MDRIVNAVDKYRNLILEAERYIWENPETGYKEVKTTKYLAEKFIELGYDLTYADGITGFYTVIDTGREGPEIMILGELDSIICPKHKDADPVTGAVHSCGHNAQCAALLGVAAALKEKSVLDGLSGRIRLCAVPAEELLEMEYRSELMKKGIIKYYGGKTEYLHRGYFDGVDIAFMVHTSSYSRTTLGSVGIIAKRIIYKGVASHAGSSPWDGKNALYAATCGINAVNAIRETFKEEDCIRFHPIITHGGDMVNAIPGEVRIETYVRGKEFDGIIKNNKKINQALAGAALSLGANVEIIDEPGYAPHKNSKEMKELASQTFREMFPDKSFTDLEVFATGSTDMGDLSCIMPVVHPYIGGTRGKAHGDDYEIYDPELACVCSAKWQVGMLKRLLEKNGELAKKIIKDFKPMFNSKKEYLDYIDNLSSSGDRIEYKGNEVVVKI